MKQKLETAFVQSFNALVKAECDANPRLREQLKKTESFTKFKSCLGTFAACAAFIFFFGLLLNFPFRAKLDDPRMACLFGAVTATFLSGLFIAVRRSVNRNAAAIETVLLHLPFSREDYNTTLRKKLAAPPWIFFTGLFLMLLITAFKCGGLDGLTFLILIVFTSLCVFASWAAALWLARRNLPVALSSILFLYCLAMVFALIGFAVIHKEEPMLAACRLLENCGESIALFTPGGWTVGVFSAGINTLSPCWWFALLPLSALAISMPFALRCLERFLSFEKFIKADWLDNVAGASCSQGEEREQDAPATLFWEQDAPATFKTSRLGALERFFIRRLSTAEKTTLEHVSLKFPGWTPWTLAALGSIVATGTLFALLQATPWDTLRTFAGCFTALAVIVLILATFPPLTGLKRFVTHGEAYPFDLVLHHRIRQKAIWLRCCVMAPFYLVAGGLIGHAMGATMDGIVAAVKILAMAAFGLPYIPFFKGEPAYHLGCLRAMRQAVLLLGMAGLLIFSAVISFYPSLPPVFSFFGVALFIAVCRFCRRWFLREHNRGWVN